jgi:hypothetical protein
MNRLLPTALAAIALWPIGGCVSADDDPSHVKDLRVLGISVEPPELMADDCASPIAARANYRSEVTLTALIADPLGAGRQLGYEVLACADLADRICSDRVYRTVLSTGVTPAGERPISIRPGAVELSGGALLVQSVADVDNFHGFGGIRMPVVVHLSRGNEKIYAQKLIVFSCRMFPEMVANRTPVIPGLLVNGSPWAADETKPLQGPGPFHLSPMDFTALQEDYVVPSFDLRPVHLRESWRLSWHTDVGTISPTETGGVDFAGQESRQLVEWRPGASPGQDVNFWVVARDGRGGESWLTRRARYSP